MRKVFIIFVLLWFLLPVLVNAATITVGPSDCSASTVNAAIAGAGEGDTIQLTCTGTITWNSQVELSGGKTLKGLGVKYPNLSMSGDWPLVINSTASGIIIDITNAPNQEINRVTGLKFIGGSGATFGIASTGAGTGKDGNGAFRIDNNYFDAVDVDSRLLWIDGDEGKLTGLVDHNVLYHTYTSGYAEVFVGQDWKGASPTCYGYDSRTRPFVYGSSDFIFFEDNYFFNGFIETSGGGGRYVVRYNIFDSSSTHNDFLGVDGHGTDTGGWHCVGVVGVEMYKNNITGVGSYSYSQIADARGGKWLIYNNNAQSGRLQLNEYRALGLENYPTGGSCMSIEFNACNGAACCEAPCGAYNIQCPTDADVARCWPLPNQVANTFLWNNLKNGQYMPPSIVGTGYVKDYIVKNRDYWEPSYGLESALPQTCTADGNTFYGTTDSGKLYKCTANNVWTLQYTPYTYPHPLAVESTPTVASCSYDDVLAAVNAAQSGDTVLVPAGSCIWDNAITITKGMILQGAGIDNTIIRATSSASALIISPDSMVISNNEIIEVFGFTFDGGGRSNGPMIELSSEASPSPFKGLKFHDNKIVNIHWGSNSRAFDVGHQMYGVIYSNQFDRVAMIMGLMGGDWSGHYPTRGTWGQNYPALPSYADERKLYFEDNKIYFSSSWNDEVGWVETGQGWAGIVVRYNTWDTTNVIDTWRETWDVHGLQTADPPGTEPTCESYSTMSAEYYGNIITSNVIDRLMYHRGGWLMLFNNLLNGSSYMEIQLGEYGCNSCARGGEGYPQQINNTYIWNNIRNGNTDYYFGISGVDSCSGFPLSAREDLSYFNYNPFCTSASCTSGVGTGNSAPTGSCTTGVGFWVTDFSPSNNLPTSMADLKTYTQSGTLFKCGSNNNWVAYYTPFTYPHPLAIGSTLPPPPPAIPGDINGDGRVDAIDLRIVASDFGKTSGFNNIKSDTNNNGIVDIYDAVFVASRFT